jgi:polyisoprenoid-binding protein YceI
MKSFARNLAVTLVFGYVGTALAQHQTFHINPSRSTAKFSVEGANPGISGTFKLAPSAIEFDKKGPKIGGSVILLAASESSGDSKRDKAIRSQVLEASQYAEILFTPTSFSGSVDVSDGKSVIQVTGTLTLHGQPHPVTVPVEIHANGDQSVVMLHVVVPYVQWGLKNLSGLNIAAGPQVDVDLRLVGYLTPEN